KLGKPVKFIGVKPNLVLEKFKNNVKREAEEKIKFFSNIKNTEEFIKLEKIYKEGLNPIKREELSAAIRGRINISNYLQDILKNVKNEVIICTNIENIESKMFLFKKTIDSILKSGAKVKIALSGDEGLIKKVEKELNIRIRKVDIEAKFFIIDRKEIIFYLSKDKSKSKDDTAIWINSEFFSNAFAKIFDKAVYGISEKEKLV
ncbi:MAG: TrmB family transcriptional regulator sugar-binding domain-containing protein, partial [Candidatus Pacearchaeota archaeon]